MPKLPSVSINEKLQKRILRSKIVKILNSQFESHCHKFLKVERLQSEIQTRKQEILNEEEYYNTLLPIHPPMKFTQEQKNKQDRMITTIPTPLEMQSKLKSQLTHQELLEIGEDPAYFIQDEEMRRLNWNEEDWLSKSHTQIKQEIKLIPKINASSNLLKIKMPTIRSNTEDRSERKRKIIEERVKILKQDNEIRQQVAHENLEKKEFQKKLDEQKQDEKYNNKIDVQKKKLDAKHESQLRINEYKLQQQQIISEKILQHKLKLSEEEELNKLNQKLKQFCKERQIIQLVDEELKNKIQKAKFCQSHK